MTSHIDQRLQCFSVMQTRNFTEVSAEFVNVSVFHYSRGSQVRRSTSHLSSCNSNLQGPSRVTTQLIMRMNTLTQMSSECALSF